MWGECTFGSLQKPQRVFSEGIKFIDIYDDFGTAIDIKGNLWTWGDNTNR